MPAYITHKWRVYNVQKKSVDLQQFIDNNCNKSDKVKQYVIIMIGKFIIIERRAFILKGDGVFCFSAHQFSATVLLLLLLHIYFPSNDQRT